MPRHRIREIAALAGLSHATVDRVLHGRGTTRASSTDAVRAAIHELDRQHASAVSGSRKLTIEAIVVDDPLRSQPLRDALQLVRPRLRPQVARASVRTVPIGRPDLAAAALAGMRSRRPQGVLVDLDDDPAIVEQAAALQRAGIPVVTTLCPFPPHAAIGHSGLDNQRAGATAAYLVARSQSHGAAFAVAHQLTMTSVELQRVMAFTATIDDLEPGAEVTSFALRDVVELDLRKLGGLYVAVDDATGAGPLQQLRNHLSESTTIVGHRDAVPAPAVATQVFDFALDVSWERVVVEGCEALLEHHRRGPGRVVVTPSSPSLLTPYNVEP